jgi:hypothetical protein
VCFALIISVAKRPQVALLMSSRPAVARPGLERPPAGVRRLLSGPALLLLLLQLGRAILL